jgi:hypothetical protein
MAGLTDPLLSRGIVGKIRAIRGDVMPDLPYVSVNVPPVPPVARPAPAAPATSDGLRAAAEALEATFIAEMLKHAGVGKTPEGFGGGVGEDQFAGFLRQEQAREIAAKGGIGLAASIVEAMARMEDADDRR